MGSEVSETERELELAHLKREIAQEDATAAEARMLERAMRKRYGPNWRKVIGAIGGMRVSREKVYDMYAVNPELRELNNPRHFRGR